MMHSEPTAASERAPRSGWRLRSIVVGSLISLVAAACAQSAAPAPPTIAPAAASAAPASAAPASAAAPGAAASAQPANVLIAKVPNAPPRPVPAPLASGATPAPPPSAPPARFVPVYAHWDTVFAGPGESKYNVDASVGCTKSSIFSRGMHIVWRAEFVDTASGKILQAADMRTAVLKISNGDEAKFNFGRHGALAESPWFWTATWDVPLTYPLGVLNWSINLVTTSGKEATITDNMAINSPAWTGAVLDDHVLIVQ